MTPLPSPTEVPLIPPHTPLHGWLTIIAVMATFIFLGYVRLWFTRRHKR